ncbi:MAG: TonB family protein [Pseudomonadota bacterium]|nr:TonB family protein [Pseudomonadota bacterium]
MRGFFIATGVSLGLHMGAMGLMSEPTPPAMDGGSVAGEVALGMGFADLVAGTNTPPVDMTQPVEPAPMTPSAPVQPITAQRPAQTLTPATTATAASSPSESPALHPEITPPKTVPLKTLTATDATPTPPKPPAPKPQSAGNGEVNQTKGQQDGTKTATKAEVTKKADTASNATQAGDGAIKSYQTYVLRRIARTPNRSAGARGTALVGLAIAPSGQISAVKIVKGSGHSGIDQVAVDQVRRAGPFKPTPSGQTVRVVVRVESKG